MHDITIRRKAIVRSLGRITTIDDRRVHARGRHMRAWTVDHQHIVGLGRHRRSTGLRTRHRDAIDTCEQGLFTIYILSDSVGIGNLVAAENGVFQHKTAISSLILGTAQVPLYARGTTGAGSTSAWGEVGSKSIPIRVRAASARNIYFLLVADSAYTPKKSGKFYLTAKSKY